ncbi:hypothetical protein V9T40_011707 [Parthenolecanium corni]|uniref:DUF4604 domain-containing protein n=1 Tax=Parthenolecanium corni TaxID=536013 RepID=A0AAN9TLN2_9HEMI
MSKRNVSFIRPEEPSFLKKLKQQIGYREGPTVETKREKLPELDDADDDRLDDQPVVVVLKAGDLTAEQVEKEKKILETEKASKPADLNKKIVFCPSAKRKTTEEASNTSNSSSSTEKVKQVAIEEGPPPRQPSQKEDIPKNRNQAKSTLSFDADEEDEF